MTITVNIHGLSKVKANFGQKTAWIDLTSDGTAQNVITIFVPYSLALRIESVFNDWRDEQIALVAPE